jgi:hypothetical protein
MAVGTNINCFLNDLKTIRHYSTKKDVVIAAPVIAKNILLALLTATSSSAE